MRFRDALQLAVGALRMQRRRTALSLLGTAIGVGAVLLLTGVGQGARAYVQTQVQGLGHGVIAVLPGKVETTGGMPGIGGVPNDLTLGDGLAVARRVRSVERVAPLVIANETVEHDARSRQVIVLGTTPELRPIRELELRSGSFLPEGPWDRGAAVVVLGQGVARELFPAGDALGNWLRLGGWRLRVLGVLATQGRHFGIDMDETVFVPVATAQRMFDQRSLSRLVVAVRDGSSLERAEADVAAVLRERHGEEDFTVTTPDAIAEAVTGVLDVLTLALAGIAAVSLAVAGIGTMNVMLVAVSERTGEIGLLRAIGADRRHVSTVFLIEAALLSGAGGLCGLVLGWVGILLVARLVPALPAELVPWAAVAAVATAVLVGLVFGLLPARRAVLLDPVDALAKGQR